MRLLIPYDFSANANHAVAYATMLVGKFNQSTIHLLHVLVPVLHDVTVINDIHRESQEALTKVADGIREDCHVCTVSTSIENGEVVVEIAEAAEKQKIGIIVMGLAGVSKVSRWIFGSNTLEVIKRTSRTVLVVPELAVLQAPERIVFATDYYDSDPQALEKLIPIARHFHAEIILLHVYSEEKDVESESAILTFAATDSTNVIAYPHVSFQLYKGETTVAGIAEYCEKVGAHLLALVSRKHNHFQNLFNKSTSNGLTYASKIPLFIFPVEQMEKESLF